MVVQHENKQIVFKTSKKKLFVAHEMCTAGNLLAKEFCCFDGKVKRTSNFTMLTVSVYHPVLQKQISLATMECVTEDTSSVELFWRVFNNAYCEAKNTNERFNPVGWKTDMATANFNGLAKIYGEDILENIKGCEFHYQKSVNNRTRNLRKYGSQFKTMALELLESGTKEVYQFAHEQILLKRMI